MRNSIPTLINNWQYIWWIYFRWWREATIAKKIVVSLIFSGLMGISAQIRIPLVFTPVPITLQVFVVLMSGSLLGAYAGMSQLFYVLLGIAGIPWFAGFKSGLPLITGGYLVGFIPAALLVGHFTHGYKHLRNLQGQLLIMMGAIVVIYIFGAVWFSLVTGSGFSQTMYMAVYPFIGVDMVKALCAAFISTLVINAKEGGKR
jgi:biotin transport system substrate-specific component